MRIQRLLAVVALVFALSACSNYQKLLKSTDYELKYEKAKEYYNKDDFNRAGTLLEELVPIFKGTDRAEESSYFLAQCYYGQKLYFQAGHHFRQFVKAYPTSNKAEDSQYMSAYCYYQESPNPRLDQDFTYKAIEEFQLFVNLYPSSERVDQVNKYIDELSDKLVYKSYLNSKLYFDLGNYMGNNYQSCVIAAENSLKEFPDTKYREELRFLILKAKFIQAVNSVDVKKEDRYQETIDEYFTFLNEFPESKFMKEAKRMYEDSKKRVKY